MNYSLKLTAKIIGSIPRVLSLLDKNLYSTTYGSFDRKYWHYKIIDFPCGMQQELVLPLAYVWKTEFEGNKYYQLPRIKDYLEGIFRYHEQCCHPDGSMDDYFPHERAFGATAYALTALSEAALLTGICPDEALKSLEKSGGFLADYREAGKLSNHLAIASDALINLSLLTGKQQWKEKSNRLIDELSKMQHAEGWFPEYEGCDLGYQTVSVEFLARRYQKAPSALLYSMLSKNIKFLRSFVHPDGSIGGEYGSRNTYNFYPGGFAILSSKIPLAAEMLSYFLRGLEKGAINYLEDDGVFGHMLSSYVTVLSCGEINVPENITGHNADKTITYYEGAGLFIGRTGSLSIFGTTTKGGVCKVFRDDDLVISDTGYIGELSDGSRFCQNKAGCSKGKVNGNEVIIEGCFKKFTSKRLGRVQMIGLRVLSLLFGRMKNYSNFIRHLMQKVLIYSHDSLDITFRRTINLRDDGIKIMDEINMPDNIKITSLHRSTDCVNMHVITSDSFQAVNLLPWERMSVEGEKTLRFERTITD